MTNANAEIFPIIVPVNNHLQSLNFYLLKTENSLMLIDAGMNIDDCWNALHNTLTHNGLELKDITHIIVTHHHVDHIGLINRIVNAHPVPVYAHRLSIPRLTRDVNYLQKRIEFFQNLYAEMGCKDAGKRQVEYLKKAIKNNKNQALECNIHNIEELPVHPFEVIEIPGHAVDQIALYNPQQRVLIAGDLLIEHISSNALIEPDGNGNRIKSLLIHEASLKKVQQLDVKIIYPGHGKIIDKPYDLIKKRIAGIDAKANKLLDLLKDRRLTASELAQQYYKEMYKKQFALVMSEVIGHLDYLEEKGKIGKEFEGGVWKYFTV